MDSCKDRGNKAGAFVADPVEYMLVQQRRLFEGGFKDIQQLALTLALDLYDGSSRKGDN